MSDRIPSYWLSPAGLRKLFLRMLAGFSLGGAIFAGYWALQRTSLRPVWWLEPSALESWIPTSNSALVVYVYLSFYLLVLIPGFLPTDLQFRRFLIALAFTGGVSLAVFLLIPSGVLRPPEALVGASGAYLSLVEVDLPRNAFPSLHASVSSLAGITAAVIFEKRYARWLLWLWVTAVLWSTMATRQHVLFDAVSGASIALIGWIAAGKVIESRNVIAGNAGTRPRGR